MASSSALGVDIISDSSNSSSETDSDSDGNLGFYEFDSDSGRDEDAFLGFGDPGDAPVLPGLNRTDHGRTQSLILTIPIPDQPIV